MIAAETGNALLVAKMANSQRAGSLIPRKRVATNPQEAEQTDVLNRKQQAEELANLLMHSQEPRTVIVNGQYGSGKSHFLQILKNQIKPKSDCSDQSANPVTVLDAWQHDIDDNPFTALTVALDETLGITSRDEITSPSSDKIKQLATTVSKSLLSTAIHKASHGFIDPNQITQELKNDGAPEASQFDERMEAYRNHQKQRNQLKSDISSLKREMFGETPIVILIDELDRSRPSFAVKMLEEIKHLFDIDGIVFVLALDYEHLRNAVRGVYGPIDAHGYLRRFFDWSFELDTPDYDTYIDHCLRTLREDPFYPPQDHESQLHGKAKEALKLISEKHQITLRDIDKILTHVLIVTRGKNERNSYILPIVFLYFFIYWLDPSSYESLIQGNIDNERLRNEITPRILPMKHEANEELSKDVEIGIGLLWAPFMTPEWHNEFKRQSDRDPFMSAADAARYHQRAISTRRENLLTRLDRLVRSPLSVS